ncbi:MAG: Zn-ribbon domain-containing OB-fold protein [Dehalococcoidia bacterium]
MEPGEKLIEEGLFQLDEAGEPRLLGSRCTACGAVFGSRRRVCLACLGREMEEHLIVPEGEVQSATTVHQAGGRVVLDIPYVIAQVGVGDRVVVTAPVVDCEPAEIAIGTRVKGRTLRFEDKDGEVVVSWAFAPLGTEKAEVSA